jgi:hypothetical protein
LRQSLLIEQRFSPEEAIQRVSRARTPSLLKPQSNAHGSIPLLLPYAKAINAWRLPHPQMLK